MSIRNLTQETFIPFFSYEPVENCKGPYTSTEKGGDAVCCSKCYHIRNIVHKGKAILCYGTQVQHFTDIINIYKYVKFSKSSCGLTCYAYRVGFIPSGNIGDGLKDFFLFRNEKMVADKEIYYKQVYSEQFEQTIIFPSENTKTYEHYGTDNGVDNFDKYIIVKNIEKAFESGKFMYIINYYQTLNILDGKEDEDIINKKLTKF